MKNEDKILLDDILERVEKIEIDSNRKKSWKRQILAVPNLIALSALAFGIFQYFTPDYNQLEINKRQIEILKKEKLFWDNQSSLKEEFEIDSRLRGAQRDIEQVLRLFSNKLPVSVAEKTRLYAGIAQVEKTIENYTGDKYQYYHLLSQAYSVTGSSAKARDAMNKAISTAKDENVNQTIIRQLYLELLGHSTRNGAYEKLEFAQVENEAVILASYLRGDEKNAYLSQIYANSVVASIINLEEEEFTKSSSMLDKYPNPGKSQVISYLATFPLKEHIKNIDFFSKIDVWIDMPDDYDIPVLPVNGENFQFKGFSEPYHAETLDMLN